MKQLNLQSHSLHPTDVHQGSPTLGGDESKFHWWTAGVSNCGFSSRSKVAFGGAYVVCLCVWLVGCPRRVSRRKQCWRPGKGWWPTLAAGRQFRSPSPGFEHENKTTFVSCPSGHFFLCFRVCWVWWNMMITWINHQPWLLFPWVESGLRAHGVQTPCLREGREPSWAGGGCHFRNGSGGTFFRGLFKQLV